jgi:Cof subfamily protein (haloacid dehalogenase superfamily)
MEAMAVAPVKKLRLVVLDMDGTALNAHHQFSQGTIEKLRYLAARNVTIAFATGRSSQSVTSYLEMLQLEQEIVPVICFNGSVGLSYTRNSCEYGHLFAHPLPLDGARKLVEFAERKGHLMQYYDGITGTVYAAPKNQDHVKLLSRYEALVGRAQTRLDSLDEISTRIQPAKILILTEEVDKLLEDIQNETNFHSEFHVIRGSPEPSWFVEFLLPNVNKGTALRSLADTLGISIDEIVSFGDGDNDIEMLSCGCRGVAMRNGRDAVKLAAVEVTEHTNDDDGVAAHLEKLEMLGLF